MGIPSQLELFQPITASFYVVARDFGFAPNPFWGWCTLATCKPEMRRKSNVGDYIIGLSSVAGNQDKNRKIVYVMLVEEILSFDKYWCDPRFLWKRPRFNASKAEVYGDNIYHRENGDWVQEKSHHSQFDGSEYLPCKFNTENDTSADCVLISSNFVYWGGNPITLPKCIDQKKVNNFSRGHCNRSDFFSCPDEFVKWFNSLSQKGRIEMPKSFNSAVKHELGSKSRMQRRVSKMTKAKYSDLICKDMSEFVIRDQVSPLSWDAYVNHVKETNKFESMGKILQLKYGLFGEIGSVLTGCKKFARDQNDYPKYQQDLLENIGDALWYLVAYGSVSAFDMAGLSKLYNERFTDSSASEPDVASLQKLAGTIGNFLTLEKDEDEKTKYNEVIEHYIRFISNSKLNFRYILFKNYEKTAGVFLHYNAFEFENFDHECPEDERFPKILEFEIFKRSNGKVYLKHHEMFVGDPLSDNIADKDAYAFHDILHLANVAILNWSPTIRGLLKRKRKSVGKKDEEEDGRRAIVVDEGVTALIFSYAKDMEFFQGVDKVPSELLNMIKIFVRGYEVEKCSPALWNHAIIEGYKVFRDVKEHLEGTVKIDTVERKISFEPRKR